MELCFFTRCKPQGADAISLVREIRRAFVGYPPYRDGAATLTRTNVRSCLYDLSADEPERLGLPGMAERVERSYRRQVSVNKNLIREVAEADEPILLIPRPEAGLCIMAKVERFELTDRPTWIDAYKQIREEQADQLLAGGNEVWLNESNHIGDVVQTFLLTDMREVGFFAIPGWVRHQLFGRATSGRIRSIVPGQDVYKILRATLETGVRQVASVSATSPDEVEGRLLNFVTPAVFESMVAELLHLDNPHENWWQVGGPGDGGVDVLGFDKEAKLVGAAQCKLSEMKESELVGLGKQMAKSLSSDARNRVYVFSLYTNMDEVKQDGVTVIGRQAIIKMLMRHAERSVFASMIGVQGAAAYLHID